MKLRYWMLGFVAFLSCLLLLLAWQVRVSGIERYKSQVEEVLTAHPELAWERQFPEQADPELVSQWNQVLVIGNMFDALPDDVAERFENMDYVLKMKILSLSSEWRHSVWRRAFGGIT